ncbi:hypothetical protein DB354_07935 [Opitutus sp. ER46]|nr:hypothetical protein DB354_07935 [Opitutus sp. ER46]
MLTAQTETGAPVVCAEALLREILDDISVRHDGCATTPADLMAWAFRRGEDCTDDPHCLCFDIWQSYRVMVGAFSYGYHPDWLCAAPSPALGSPKFPAWDRNGRRIV